jgi:DNA-binding SARP family transcriptional activator/predicted ATPase
MSQLALYLRGRRGVVRAPLGDEGEPLKIAGRKAVALLAYLVVSGKGGVGSSRSADASASVHSRDGLATLLWPESDQSHARAELRRGLSILRRTLGEGWLEGDRETVNLNPEAQIWLDVDAFRKRLAECETHGHGVEEVCADCVPLLEEAAALYRDDFMAGFTLRDSLAFDEWQFFQAEGLRQALALALERLVRWHGDQGAYETAIPHARRWLALDRLHEPAHRQLMVLYAEAGQRAAALRQYRTCVRTLEEELGIAPSAETHALYEQIRVASEIAPVTPPPPTPAPVLLPLFLAPDAPPMAVEPPFFVTRERELARLDGFLDEALAGQGRVVFVTGGPGRGKTALMRAFAQRATDVHPDLLVAQGNCSAYSGAGDPYLPFREVLGMLTGDIESRWAAGAVSTAGARRMWAAVPLAAQALLDHGPYMIGALVPGPTLFSRAGAVAPEEAEWLRELQAWAEREPMRYMDLEQHAVFQQVTNTLLALADEHPLLLTLDDLQWVDAGSASLLFHLGRRLADQGGRILIVGAYRPEELAYERDGKDHPLQSALAEFQRRFGDVWVDLAQADQAQGRRFVEAFLDTEPNRLGEGFRTALSQRTGGHALFTIELLRTMQDRGDLVQDEEGRWTEGLALDWEALPARVEAVVKARVDRLDEGQRDLLAAASVEGEIFTAQVLAQVQGSREREVLRVLSRELGPQGHRLVRQAGEERVAGAERYLSRYHFTHALFQSYLYHHLSPGERRLLHHETATALEGLYGAQVDAVVVPLAHHYYEAGETEQAILYALRAGDKAYRAYANEQAVLYFQRVLDLLPSISEDTKEGQWRLAALSGLGRVQSRAGQVEAAARYLREAITLGREIDMPLPDLLRLHYWLGDTLWWQGRFLEILRVGQEGLALLGDDVESVEAALMYDTIALGHFSAGAFADWRKHLKRAAEFLQALPYTEELRAAYVHLANLHYFDKDVWGALGWLEALEGRATRHQDLRALGSAQFYRAAGLILQGDYPRSLPCYQQAVELFAKIGDEKELYFCYADLAEGHWTLGDLDMAEWYAGRMLAGAETVGSDLLGWNARTLSGLTALARRSRQAAQEHFERAVHYRLPLGLGYTAWAMMFLGRTSLAQGDRAAALQQFQDAVACAGPLISSQEILSQGTVLLASVLSGLDEAHQDPVRFRTFCDHLRAEHPEFESCGLVNWYLVPAEPRRGFRTLLAGFGGEQDRPQRLESEIENGEWLWQDPFGDCSFALGNGLVIHAANGRHLWFLNRSAPRLFRQAPENVDWAAQTGCRPAWDDRPAIGGLLLWQDQENYLCLGRGFLGPCQIGFSGCLENHDAIIGLGRLPLGPTDHIFLRLERVADHVSALCSADGERWFSVGTVAFPVEGPLQVGLHAIGYIHRHIYHGAYPEGAAIRFESFTLWGMDR